MHEHDDKFPPGTSDEQKSAILWKIEHDYRYSNTGAIMFKQEYMTFAIRFYTRNHHSIESIVAQYRAHCIAAQRRRLAEAFLTDIKARLKERELAHN